MALVAPMNPSTIALPALPGLADRCRAALGADLTAYLAGAGSVAEFDSWRTATTAPACAHAVVRLVAGVELIRTFAADNLLSHLPHWLREMTDTEVGPLVPARAIRSAGEEIQPIKTVLHAAHTYVTEQRSTRLVAA